jgi:hypothetical protein
MKLDPDLVRAILIAYEELPYGGGGDIKIEGYNRKALIYHQVLLEEAGYIKVFIQEFDDGEEAIVFPERLTYQGHEFLNASRDEGRWKTVRDALNKSGGFVMDVAQALLIAALRDQLHLP